MPETTKQDQGQGLIARGITVRYGGAVANNDIDIEARAGIVTGCIGPNGAGKTSFVDAITGFTACSGEVTVDGRPLTGLAPHKRAHAGLVRTWQAGDLFNDATVAQNLQIAAEGFQANTTWRDLFTSRRSVEQSQAALVSSVLERLDILHTRDRRPTELSLGEQRLVGVARALVMKPAVLLLDEPAAGLDTRESRKLGATIAEIAREGVAVLLIEHDIDLVLAISAQVFVLDYGRVIAAGTPAEIRKDPAVIAAYLGEPTEEEVSHG
ncbi:ABC transporter ATP-binding protein [Nocardioides sp. GCM10030258]|uniref:ABC transporter ATP-binding protein n=1 Tax=unclassified Nocardioides TaxID=2615069 RepID=UPI00361D37DB